MKSTILIVEPVPPDNDYESHVQRAETTEEYFCLYDEFFRLEKLFKSVGFTTRDTDTFFIDASWFNGEGKVKVRSFEITDAAIKELEGRAEEMRRLRASAYSKLTTDELAALGVFKNDGYYCEECLKRELENGG